VTTAPLTLVDDASPSGEVKLLFYQE